MKLTIERLPESRVQLEITAEEEETNEAMLRAVRKVGNQVTVPGFRKGKAPRAMIEQLYGADVFTEEANRYLMTDLYRKALETEELTPVGDPEVDITSTEPLSYTVIVPIYPVVDPGDYRAVRIEPIDAAVDDKAVDELIESLRKAQSPWVDPEGEGLQVGAGLELTPKSRHPREEDQVTLDYTVQEEGEEVEEPVADAVFVLGESGLLQAVEDAIMGLRVGESSDFAVSFDADDESIDPSVRGKTLQYHVTLKGLKERDLIALDDDFAKAVGETDTLAQLRQDLADNIHQRQTAEARGVALGQIIDKIAEGASIELPAPMVDQAVEDDIRRLRGNLAQQGVSLEAYLRATEADEATLRAEMRPAAYERLRNSLLLRTVAEREAITVEDEKIDAAVERMARIAQESQQPTQAEAFARSARVRDLLGSELFDRELTDRLIEMATEGRGAVINGWEPPVAEATDESAVSSDATESEAASAPAENGDASDEMDDSQS